ncbi:MAG: glutamyl-tRNA reductase [Bacteroidota bacterium]
MFNQFHIIAFTHRNVDLSDIGTLHIADENQEERLSQLKAFMQLDEMMFLSTCNRVEFILVANVNPDEQFLTTFFNTLYPSFTDEQIQFFVERSEVHSSTAAVEHLLSVAASIDSMVIGEREIITQVRKAFEESKRMQLTGDFIRLAIRHTIETAKKVYTETSIATKPVSVVSLAYHRLRDLNVPLDARVIIVGAGVTNTNMSKFLKKHGFKNFAVFNRTESKAQALAKELNGQALSIAELSTYTKGFDVMIACTGSDHHLISPSIYQQLLQNEEDKKVVIDLALPQDIDPSIVENNKLTHISVEYLQKISNENLKERSKEIQHVEEIIQEALFEFKNIERVRSVELAMRAVPQKVKEIKSNAINDIFKEEIDELDEKSLELLNKVIGYMEKKYMSVPMIMAKEILLKH